MKFSDIKLTQIATKNSIFGDIAPCNPLEGSRCFPCYLFHPNFLPGLFFCPEDEGDIFLGNVC
jgi:hypothetical protein